MEDFISILNELSRLSLNSIDEVNEQFARLFPRKPAEKSEDYLVRREAFLLENYRHIIQTVVDMPHRQTSIFKIINALRNRPLNLQGVISDNPAQTIQQFFRENNIDTPESRTIMRKLVIMDKLLPLTISRELREPPATDLNTLYLYRRPHPEFMSEASSSSPSSAASSASVPVSESAPREKVDSDYIRYLQYRYIFELVKQIVKYSNVTQEARSGLLQLVPGISSAFNTLDGTGAFRTFYKENNEKDIQEMATKCENQLSEIWKADISNDTLYRFLSGKPLPEQLTPPLAFASLPLADLIPATLEAPSLVPDADLRSIIVPKAIRPFPDKNFVTFKADEGFKEAIVVQNFALNNAAIFINEQLATNRLAQLWIDRLPQSRERVDLNPVTIDFDKSELEAYSEGGPFACPIMYEIMDNKENFDPMIYDDGHTYAVGDLTGKDSPLTRAKLERKPVLNKELLEAEGIYHEALKSFHKMLKAYPDMPRTRKDLEKNLGVSLAVERDSLSAADKGKGKEKKPLHLEIPEDIIQQSIINNCILVYLNQQERAGLFIEYPDVKRLKNEIERANHYMGQDYPDLPVISEQYCQSHPDEDFQKQVNDGINNIPAEQLNEYIYARNRLLKLSDLINGGLKVSVGPLMTEQSTLLTAQRQREMAWPYIRIRAKIDAARQSSGQAVRLSARIYNVDEALYQTALRASPVALSSYDYLQRILQVGNIPGEYQNKVPRAYTARLGGHNIRQIISDAPKQGDPRWLTERNPFIRVDGVLLWMDSTRKDFRQNLEEEISQIRRIGKQGLPVVLALTNVASPEALITEAELQALCQQYNISGIRNDLRINNLAEYLLGAQLLIASDSLELSEASSSRPGTSDAAASSSSAASSSAAPVLDPLAEIKQFLRERFRKSATGGLRGFFGMMHVDLANILQKRSSQEMAEFAYKAWNRQEKNRDPALQETFNILRGLHYRTPAEILRELRKETIPESERGIESTRGSRR